MKFWQFIIIQGYKEIRVIEEDEPLSEEVIPTRVTIFVNENGMVTYVPRVCW